MDAVQLKRKKGAFTAIVILSAFLLLIGLLLALLSIFNTREPYITAWRSVWPITAFACVVMLLGIYLLYSYRKNTPTISIDRLYITVSGRTFRTEDLESINGLSKKPLNIPHWADKLLGAVHLIFSIVSIFSSNATAVGDYDNSAMPYTALRFKNRTVICFYDDSYTNAEEFKLYVRSGILKSPGT